MGQEIILALDAMGGDEAPDMVLKGANIARLELKCAFENILAKLPNLARTTEGKLPMNAPAFACGLRTLPVRVDRS